MRSFSETGCVDADSVCPVRMYNFSPGAYDDTRVKRHGDRQIIRPSDFLDINVSIGYNRVIVKVEEPCTF